MIIVARRLLPAITLAVPVVILIFMVMHLLIDRPLPEHIQPVTWQSVQFVTLMARQEKTDIPSVEPLRPDTPPPPEMNMRLPQAFNPVTPPVVPRLQLSPISSDLSFLANLQANAPQPPAASPAISNALAVDQPLIPLVRIEPRYPSRAAMNGIEGWVKVRYTINIDGTVSDAQIIDAKPKRIFNRAALRAIKKWRFRPSQVNGQAVVQNGIQVFNFEL